MQLRKDRDEWKDDAVRSADAMPPDAELTEVLLLPFLDIISFF